MIFVIVDKTYYEVHKKSIISCLIEDAHKVGYHYVFILDNYYDIMLFKHVS